MSTDIATYLKYANLQMAAEATDLAPGMAGLELERSLVRGNNRASKFTDVGAAEFAQLWEVVNVQKNTDTGFSGTLFRARMDAPQELLTKYGIQAGELVVSLRSTEFVDDAARDTEATDKQELHDHGWAFGQISDMQQWVNGLLDSNTIDLHKTVSVTGYSLGGHLAAAFSELYPNAATSTYTFNAPGMGKINDGSSLVQIIDAFSQRRGGANADLFSDPDVRQLYDRWKSILSESNSLINLGSIDSALSECTALADAKSLANNPVGLAQAQLLLTAVNRSRMVATEALRAPTRQSGTAGVSGPTSIALADIAALALDYQLAVIKAGARTSNYGVQDTIDKGVWPTSSVDERRALGLGRLWKSIAVNGGQWAASSGYFRAHLD